ncbi:MAG: WYL domain-containing protein, partial [bacterium]|nr:WYL domain-containing protein [bacterium]
GWPMPPETSGARVVRLLAMMSYLTDRGEVQIAEIAAHFGVREAQVMKDLSLLWVTGLPGYFPDDLIEFDFDEDETSVELLDGRGLSRPVPFAPREALALAAAVEWLRASGTATGSAAEAIESVAGKLRGLVPADLAGGAGAPLDAAVRERVLRAASSGEGLTIRYVSAQDEVTERVVVPAAVTTDGAHWYLDAWCTRARAQRTFRMDRILSIEDAPPAVPTSGSDDEGVGSVPVETRVRLVLHPRARWLAEDIPGAEIASEDGASLVVELELGRWDWLVRVLLGLGDAVRAVSPPELAAELRARAAAALAAYGEG